MDANAKPPRGGLDGEEGEDFVAFREARDERREGPDLPDRRTGIERTDRQTWVTSSKTIHRVG